MSEFNNFMNYCEEHIEPWKLAAVYGKILADNSLRITYENEFYSARLRMGRDDIDKEGAQDNPATNIFFDLKDEFDKLAVHRAIEEDSDMVLYLAYRQMRAILNLEVSEDIPRERSSRGMQLYGAVNILCKLLEAVFDHEAHFAFSGKPEMPGKAYMREIAETFFDWFEEKDISFKGKEPKPWQNFGAGLDGFMKWGLACHTYRGCEPQIVTLKPLTSVFVA